MKELALALLLPAVVCAQAKPAAKPAVKPAPMTHDMSKMGADSAMKHDVAGMGGGMMQGGMKTGWGELDAYHALLMSMWHPAQKDSLTMARSLAGALVATGEAWEKSKGPAACDNAAARKVLPSVISDTKSFATLAANKAKDADVKGALKKVHDGFEKIMMPCMQAKMKGMPGMDSMMKRMHSAEGAKKP